MSYWNANIPAERLIEPAEIAQACVFLLSDRASAITGDNILADLGMTSQLISKESYSSKVMDEYRQRIEKQAKEQGT